MSDTQPPVVLAPLKLDAFVLNESLCKTDDTFKIGPITQPNYTFLRLTDSLLTADVLDHVDLHTSTPAELNSRITDLGTGQTHLNRLGVYVKWTLPPVYRTGAAAAAITTQEQFDDHQTRKLKAGFPSQPSVNFENVNTNTPQMRPVPNRWLVVRRLDKTTMVPSDADVPPVQAWLIESDRLHTINDADLADRDLEVDVAPFVNLNSTAGDSVIDGQAEIFVGSKTLIYPTVGERAPNPTYIDLDVLTSANPLFADYQHHNNGVFSMVDDFAYGPVDNPSRLSEAHAAYQVIGWHSVEGNDPFTTDPSVTPIPNRLSRLQALQMRLKAPTVSNPDQASSIAWVESPDFAKIWLEDDTTTRIVTHATMYGVHWKSGLNGRPTTCLADAAAASIKKQPISVGTSALDALYAYCRVHDESDTEPDLVRMEKDLVALHDLLRTADADDVDALQAAQDEAYEQAFAKFDGETHWYFSGNTLGSNQPIIPNVQDRTKVMTLNSLQRILDISQRELKRAKWELFAAWWNFVSGWAAKTTTERPLYRQKVTGLKDDVARISASCQQLQTAVDQQLATFGSTDSPQKGTGDRYFQRKDPTIMVGGVKSGWEPDFSDLLPVRIADQVVSTESAAWGITPDVFATIAGNLPSDLSAAATALLSEFQSLSPQSNLAKLNGSQTLPWFHPDAQLQQGDRNHWNGTQPWQPLFIEWEAVYTHIPWDSWKLEKTHQHSQWGHKIYKYAVTTDLAANPPTDTRDVSGRVLLLAQTASTLQNTLDEFFRSTNPQDLVSLYGMSVEEQNFILAEASTVELLSSPLDGLTSHLLTLQQGSHLKPTINFPNLKSQPIVAATTGSISDVGFVPADLLNMETESAATPYGATALDSTSTPLKLMTHGQLMFTKINVIDKFGQAICAIDPGPRHRRQPIPTISPCLGDTYFPDLIGVDENQTTPTGHRNLVLTADKYTTSANTDGLTPVNDQNDCPFVQLTPAINMPARVNGSFCVKGADGVFQPCTEWENPIWGWLVVNYADYGLQIFRQDGTFYREVRLGGATGASAGLRWLPFDPPTATPTSTPADTDVQQLELLIERLSTAAQGQATYMEAFFGMIEQSIEGNQTAAPSSYSTFATAVVGKPLALVNVAFSLELSGPEPKNWSLVSPQPADIGFLPDPSNPTKKIYTFDYKLGDSERSFDGLVGYFKTQHPPGSSSPSAQSDYDLDNLYTFFTQDKASTADPRQQLDDDANPHFEKLTPYWSGLPDTTKMDPTKQADRDAFASGVTALHRDQMEVFGVICDPFLPIHAYSAILPNLALKLPPWTVETAMAKMTAFWHSGPLVVTRDVASAYNEQAPLDADYSAKLLSAPPTADQAALLPPPPSVQIPLTKPLSSTSGEKATYKWLQPYQVSSTVNGTAVTQTRFNPLDIAGDSASGADAATMRLEPGPYTALEGFVQLAKPIIVAPSA